MAPANKRAWLRIAVSAVIVLLLGGLIFLLFRALGQSDVAAKALDDARVRLEKFYERNPFPNHTNVLVEKSNAATMRQWREELLRTLSADQVETPSKTPAQFEIFLTARSKDLRDAAMRNGVALPAGFSFGFGRYSDGRALPESRDDLPTRLAEQLVLVDHICRLLFEERVTELVSVTRDEFGVEKGDASAPGSGGSRIPSGPRVAVKQPGSAGQSGATSSVGAGRSPAVSEYRKLHFTFEMRVREAALTGILNRLASDSMFIVVTSVEIDTPADQQLGAQPRREDVTNTVGRVARAVCGPDMTEPAQVKIEVDVYRF